MSWFRILWKENGTEWLLDQWGVWSRIPEGGRLSYPSKSNFVGLQGGGLKALQIDLDTALMVDSVVLRAAQESEMYKKAIMGRYVQNLNYTKLAKHLHTNRTEATAILGKAETFIDGLLTGAFDFR